MGRACQFSIIRQELCAHSTGTADITSPRFKASPRTLDFSQQLYKEPPRGFPGLLNATAIVNRTQLELEASSTKIANQQRVLGG